jgi:hypothetical protein
MKVLTSFSKKEMKMAQKIKFAGIKHVVKQCAEKLGSFEEVGDDTTILPPFEPKSSLYLSDILALLWGTIGLVSIGYSLGLMR